MNRGMNKIIIVTRKTRLAELIYKYNTVEQARFYVEHMGMDFSDYVVEDANYNSAVQYVTQVAGKYARVGVVERAFIPNMILDKNDVVIVVGQDGLVANTMKYLDGQPIIGVNPDVKRWDGILLPFEAREMDTVIPNVIGGRFNVRKVTMAKAETKDGQTMLAVNDFFIGCNSHGSARYEISVRQQKERQSSSGIIISTGVGSTGWYKSVITQARQIANAFGNNNVQFSPIEWNANKLMYMVREPYPSCSTGANLVFGAIEQNDKIILTSNMPVGGIIFSDGIQDDAMDFNAGMEVQIGIAPNKGELIDK